MHGTQTTPTATGNAHLQVRFVDGETYEAHVRGHRLRVDQPADVGGTDAAPTPTEPFVASLATCVAFYAGRYLTRHGYSRDGLGVTADYQMATDRPARITAIQLGLRVPADLPSERRPALQAVAAHCTVHNSLRQPPAVSVELS